MKNRLFALFVFAAAAAGARAAAYRAGGDEGNGFPLPDVAAFGGTAFGAGHERLRTGFLCLEQAKDCVATNEVAARGGPALRLLSQAEDVFKQALGSPDLSVAATLGLAAACELRGDADRGLAYLAEGLQKHPANAHLLNCQGWLLRMSGRLKESEQAYASATRSQPALPDAHRGLADVLVDMARSAEAVKVCEAAVAQWPNHEWLADTLVKSLSLSGRRDDASRLCESLLNKHADWIRLRYRRGQLLLRSKRTEEGAAELREVLRLNPLSCQAYNELGCVSLDKKAYQEALSLFRDGLRVHPQCVTLLENIGLCYLEMKEYDRSVEVLRHARRVNASGEGAVLNMASAYLGKGDFTSALAVCTNAVLEKPWSRRVHFKACECLLKMGRPEDALAYARRGIVLGTPEDYCWALQGEALSACKLYDEASECYSRAALLNTTSVSHAFARAATLLDSGRVDESLLYCQAAQSRFPESLSLCHLTGIGLKRQGKLREAVACLQKVAETLPVPAGQEHVVGFAWAELGSINMEQQRWAEAVEAYSNALRSNPSNVAWEAECIRAEGWLAPQQARRKLEEALRRQPNHPKLLALRANQACQWPTQERAEVLRDVEAKAAADPEARYWCGCLANSLGLREQAAAHWLEAVRLSPKWAPPYDELGKAAHQRKAPLQEVLPFHIKAIELEPSSAAYRNNLGYAYLMYGQHADAVRELEQALALDPSFGLAHYNLGLAEYARGQHKEALAAIQKALRLGYTGDPIFVRRLAERLRFQKPPGTNAPAYGPRR